MKMQREKELLPQVKKGLIVIVLLAFLAAIFLSWLDTCHRFGQNLYHLLNP